MNPKTTWYLTGAALLLLGYIVLFDRYSVDSATRAAMALKLLPDVHAAKADAIDMTLTSGTRLRVERSGSEWNLTAPFYPAQSGAIEAFLRMLEQLPKYSYLTPKELQAQANARAGFGLDPPRATVIVQQGTNRVQFTVGNKTLIGQQLYVQRLGDAGVAVTDAELLTWLPPSPERWRNPMLLPHERLAFDQLSITRDGSNVLTVQRDPTNQLWNLIRPLRGAPADSRLVTYVIQQLRTSRVNAFVSDDPRADLDRYGLQNPKVELALGEGTNIVFQIQFGNALTNDAEQVYARVVNYSNVVVIPKTLPDLLRLPHSDFRDRTLVTFNPRAVDRIEMIGREPFVVQRGTNNAWRLVQPFDAPAETDSVQRFLEDLSKLQIAEFYQDVETEFSKYGLTPPIREYVLKANTPDSAGATNRLLAHIQFGAGAPAATNAAVTDRVFVRRAAENSVYTVTLADAARLPQAGFELRERRIWDFASTNVASFTIVQHGRTNRFTRQPTRIWTPDAVADQALEETLHRLGQLEAVYWVAAGDDKLQRFGFLEQPHRITIEVVQNQNVNNYTVEFGRLALSGHRYAAVALEPTQRLIFKFPIPLFSLIERHLSIPPE